MTGDYLTTERGYSNGACGKEGKLWEAKPDHTPGVFVRLYRWLFGGPTS